MDADLLAAAGTLARSYHATRWDQTPLGETARWSSTLRTAVGTMLRTRFPMTLLWGPELALVYNEAYVELIGDKHPGALGSPAEEVFSEAWELIGPMAKQASDGQATFVRNQLVPLRRRGFLEDCYFTFSFSPVMEPDGTVEGVMAIAIETTEEVLSLRRQELLVRLADALTTVGSEQATDGEWLQTASDLAGVAAQVLASAKADVPEFELRLGPDAVRTSGAAFPPHPGTPLGRRKSYFETGPDTTVVWLPLRTVADAEEHPPVLLVRLSDRLPVDRGYRMFLHLLAADLAHALDRLTTADAERRLHDQERRVSTALQRSLLTRPMEPDHLQVAVRYEPAADVAQIGGDWHDSFMLPDGALAIAIGDVSGHDLDAAAAMAQARNLLRGIAYTLEEPPSVVLSALDRALSGLDVHAVASAVLARIEQAPSQAATGERTLRWSNAGHPPPILLQADGAAHLLQATPDLLLGLDPSTSRADHTATLHAGDSVVFYTDGLVERRGASIDQGLDWLVTAVTGHAELDAEALADILLAHVSGSAEDDIAILVMHAYSQAAPRPPHAGPERLPQG